MLLLPKSFIRFFFISAPAHPQQTWEALYPAFLGATKHLYNWLCPSVGSSVCQSGNAFVQQSTCRTLLAYLASIMINLAIETGKMELVSLNYVAVVCESSRDSSQTVFSLLKMNLVKCELNSFIGKKRIE